MRRNFRVLLMVSSLGKPFFSSRHIRLYCVLIAFVSAQFFTGLIIVMEVFLGIRKVMRGSA